MSEKKVAVRYLSKSGNTGKLANRIAKTAGCKAETIDVGINEEVNILFLGASVYWGGIDKKVKQFIKGLDKNRIGKVVIFSTSALAERGYPEIKKCLVENGIQVAEEEFYCRGQFTALHIGRPDEKDLAAVEKFARNAIK
ncbi:MAG: flavodoxin domain-containing protein [Mobilitalea sp.]